MKMSDTPETEAVIADMNSNIYDHAMKLERERDKWLGIASRMADKIASSGKGGGGRVGIVAEFDAMITGNR